MYLLDTDTIIYILKGNPTVERNLQGHYHDPIKMSVITLMELYYGVYKSQKVTSNLAKIKTLENSLEIIPLGQEIWNYLEGKKPSWRGWGLHWMILI